MYLQNNSDLSYHNFLSDIFKYLMIGLGLTTITSMIVIGFIQYLNLNGLLFGIVIICSVIEIIMVIRLSKKIRDLSIHSAKKYFYIYSIINGITMSFLLNIIAPKVSILAFALTFAYFGLLYTISTHTTYDFSQIGHICLYALPILLIGYIILLFYQASLLYYGIVLIDLILFTGITLYDMKKVKEYYLATTEEALPSIAMLCALEIYLDFIDIFIDIVMLIDDLI